MRPNEKNPRKKAMTYGVTAVLAVLAMLAGASVSASMEEFAAPGLTEVDPFFGTVDDATGAEDENENEDQAPSRMHDRLRRAIAHRMHDRIQDHSQDHAAAMAEHMQTRIDAGNALLLAIEFCEADVNCTGDADLLDAMSTALSEKIAHMQSNLDDPDNATAFEREPHAMPLNSTLAEIMQEKLDKVNAALTVIEFCLADESCEADSDLLTNIQDRLNSRASHLSDCLDDGVCEQSQNGRDHRSLAQRMGQHMRGHHRGSGGAN